MTVRSENAAKPPSQASTYLMTWLRTNAAGCRCLDFGCGRLRYTHFLAECSRTLGVVDSVQQLDRTTTIDDFPTTIRRHVRKKWPKCRIYTIERFACGIRERYDFVLCANVLSAIPNRAARSCALKAIFNCMSVSGHALFAHQHTNSYFKLVAESPNAVAHLDGWLLCSRGRTFYFGVMNARRIIRIVRSHGFQVLDAWVSGQSNYVLAGR
jgi:2-polyprenyl-3-methyl-5-hydroxy-6-metoxy-1,4-benzoquinol methylase